MSFSDLVAATQDSSFSGSGPSAGQGNDPDAQVLKVRRLAAGGSRIRTLGPPARVLEIGQDATPREIFAYGKAADRSAAPSAGKRFPIEFGESAS